MEDGKLNCWEYFSCGRQPGGPRVATLGVCPATTEAKLDGVNGGTNAGRTCWAVAGTLCRDEVRGVFAQKIRNCELCDFYERVADEERTGYVPASEILGLLAAD